GACMALLPTAAALAAIGFLGGLFHVLNHGLFKGLLFLNAGSILYATGTQDLNKMGGLMKFMPLTAITAIVASFSISGVPLFNGFVSKWSIYVSTVQGGGTTAYLPVCAVIAILTSALTLASFIKFFGVSFLSRTSALVTEKVAASLCDAKGSRNTNASRSDAATLEVGWMMQTPQVFLAALCVLLGVVPAIAFQLMQAALKASAQGCGAILAGAAPMTGGPLTGLVGVESAAVFMPVALAAALGLIFLVVRGVSKLGSAPRRAAVPWLCGYVREADCHRYAAHNLYGEIKRYFRWLGGLPRRQPAKPSALDES
ncbi:MAG: peroxiredoxin family protein, partial [Verrucomicrobia bacterium]|nr:peroxiredoxin family protein [Verrucomicrobiota bacterium]